MFESDSEEEEEEEEELESEEDEDSAFLINAFFTFVLSESGASFLIGTDFFFLSSTSDSDELESESPELESESEFLLEEFDTNFLANGDLLGGTFSCFFTAFSGVNFPESDSSLESDDDPVLDFDERVRLDSRSLDPLAGDFFVKVFFLDLDAELASVDSSSRGNVGP